MAVTLECPDCTGDAAVPPVDLYAHVLDPEGTSCSPPSPPLAAGADPGTPVHHRTHLVVPG